MKRLHLPSGYFILTVEDAEVCGTIISPDSAHANRWTQDGWQRFAAAMNAPRPDEQALRDEVERLTTALEWAGQRFKILAQVSTHPYAQLGNDEVVLALAASKDAQTEGGR